MATSEEEQRPSLALGGALILVAALFLVFAKDIPAAGLARNADPGPRALPLVLAMVVAAGGLIELTRALAQRWKPPLGATPPLAETQPVDASSEAPATPDSLLNFGLLSGAVLVYLVALSWVGFQISTCVFTTLVLWRLGARWWSALLCGVGIVVVVRILFVGLFHVQLPEGAFGWAF